MTINTRIHSLSITMRGIFDNFQVRFSNIFDDEFKSQFLRRFPCQLGIKKRALKRKTNNFNALLLNYPDSQYAV